jgi:hypothetical protein
MAVNFSVGDMEDAMQKKKEITKDADVLMARNSQGGR